MRLLVVDDNEDVAYMFGLLLEKLGHEVIVCTTAASALEGAGTGGIDAAFIDLLMKGEMDGFSLAQQLRDVLRSDPPMLVAVTGWATAEVRTSASEAGFSAFLVKPVEVPDLEATLEHARRLRGGLSG